VKMTCFTITVFCILFYPSDRRKMEVLLCWGDFGGVAISHL
jgi:hypothetical protein